MCREKKPPAAEPSGARKEREEGFIYREPVGVPGQLALTISYNQPFLGRTLDFTGSFLDVSGDFAVNHTPPFALVI